MPEFNRGSFVRHVRDARGIQQRELAEALGVTQPALTRFEKSQSSLRLENLERLANVLDINPEFLLTGEGNPFKQRDFTGVIKMNLFESPSGIIDLSLISLICERNKHAIFLFLIPPYKIKMNYARRAGSDSKIYCALSVQDDEGNIFLFRNKSGELFGNSQILHEIESGATEKGRYIEVYSARASQQLYDDINNWREISSWQVYDAISNSRNIETRKAIKFITQIIWSHIIMAGERDIGDNILRKLSGMNNEQCEQVINKLFPEMADVIKRHIDVQ